MLLHRISKYLGTAVRNGRTLHGHRADCGVLILAVEQLGIGSTAAAGVEPHAHCSKCFAEETENTEIILPEGNLKGAVFDEHGRRLGASIEKDDFAAPLRNTISERTEDYPYGVPLR